MSFYRAYVILLLVCSFYYCIDESNALLKPGGKNVISKTQSRIAYRQIAVKQKTSSRRCWQTCGCIFCWCKKTVCSTTYYLKTVYKAVSYTAYFPVYECAPGWKQQGNECPIAICTTVQCANRGHCSRPNVCYCTSGWTDANCTTNVNECATNNGGCDHYCNDTIGSFNCSCDAGYTLQGKTRCQDINECITTNTTGCQQLCINQPGTYECGCRTGYLLNSDNKTCSDIDECLISNGTKHGCAYRCNNTAGSYDCSCPQGYLLTTNSRDCADHDECMTGNNTCQQECINHPGHYTCDCRQGYDLNTKDNNTCLDVDECKRGIDGCGQICNNTIGGYHCQCRTGYQLASNNRSCNDINECQLGIDGCSQRCVNIIGSFYCSCRHGYYLDIDLKTCNSYPCQPIATPPYGSKTCTGFNTDDMCRFSCKTGYELVGSIVRTCMSDARWSGQGTSCLQKQCSRLQPPDNGYVYIPCASSYDSECRIGCNPGYFLDGLPTAKCSHREQWKPSIGKCKVADLCQYNPCKNGGLCRSVNATSIQCNCNNTGFKGPLCDQGQVMTPSYPIMTRGSRINVTFVFSLPDQLVIFTPISNAIIFYPSSLFIYPNHTGNQKLFVRLTTTVYSNVTGDHIVKYRLSGSGSYIYNTPSPDMVTVQGNSTCSSNQTFPKGCYQLEYLKCSKTNTSVVLYSTSPWNDIGQGVATDGVVSLKTASNVIPLSIKGIRLSNRKFSRVSLMRACSQKSPLIPCSLSGIFASEFLNTLSFPSWFSLGTTGSSNRDISDALTYLWTGQQLLNVIGDPKITVRADKLFSVLLVTDEMTLQVKGKTLRLPQSTKCKPHIVAVELCTRTTRPNVIIAFNIESFYKIKTMDIQKLFDSAGWSASFLVVQFSQEKSISRNGSLNLQNPFFGSLELFGELNATLKNGEGIVIRGSALLDAKLEKLADSLPSQWKADVRGVATLSMSIEYESRLESLVLEFRDMKASIKHQESLLDANSECRLSGQTDMLISGSLNGNSLKTSLISSYLEVTENTQALMTVNMKKYHNKTRENSTKSDGASEYNITNVVLCINGSSRYGPLSFPNTTIDVKINRRWLKSNSCTLIDGLSGEGMRMLITVNKEINLGNFIIFSPNSGHFLEARLSPKESYALLFAKARIFGQVVPVSIKITNSSLNFSTVDINVFQDYPAVVNVSAELEPWEKMSLTMSGEFVSKSGKVSLQSEIEKATNDYVKLIVTQVGKRMNITQKAQQLAESRANRTKSLLEKAESLLQDANTLYLDAVKNLSVSTKIFLEAEQPLYMNKSSDFNDTVKILESLCSVSECPFECVPGALCSMCNTNITSKIRNLCPGTCYRSVIERISPYGVKKSCQQSICKNVTALRDEIEKHSSIKCAFTSGFGEFISMFEQRRGQSVKDLSPSYVPEWLSLRMKNVLKDYLTTGDMKKAEKVLNGSEWSEPSNYSYKTMDSQRAMKCRRKSVSDWQCSMNTYTCYEESFNFQYRLVPYSCETTCETKTQTEAISTPCCTRTPCVTRVKNIACRKENAFCRIIRNAAIQKFSKARQLIVQPYKTLLNLRSMIYNAEIEVERRKINLQSLTTSRDILLKSYENTNLAAQLSKKANLKNEAKMQDALMLAKKWHSKTQPNLVRVTKVSFNIETEVDVSTVPVEIETFANGKAKKFNIILQSTEKFLDSFLHNASRTIASAYYGKISEAIRDGYKMNQDKSQVKAADKDLDALINFKRKCSLFVNYERGLSEVVNSLYDVTQKILEALGSIIGFPGINDIDVQELSVNVDAAAKLGLTKQDIDFAKAEVKKQREIVQAIFTLKLINTSTVNTFRDVGDLIFRDWFAVMEKLFQDPTIECNGFTDCMEDTLENMFYLYDNVTFPKALYLKFQIMDIKQSFVTVLSNFDLSVQEANNNAKSILDKLKQTNDRETFCATSPNITVQPSAVNEINDGNQLTLRCSAVSVPPPSYRWKKDGMLLRKQEKNELLLKNVKQEDSGNYTCIAYNHVAEIESTPSLVIVHSPPTLTKQPPSHLIVPIDGDFYLECEAVSKSSPIKYQWYFRSGMNDAYNQLPGQTFPVYSINKAAKKHQGIYKCQVSNAYGDNESQDISVSILEFVLARPGVSVTALIRLNTVDHEFESQQGLYRIERGIEDNDSEETVNTFLGNWVCPLTSLTSDCVFGTKLKECYPDVNSAKKNSTLCESTFVLRSTDTSSFNLSKMQEENADSVEDSVTQLMKAVTSLLNATSKGSHSVNIGTRKYELLKDSLSAARFLGICDQGRQFYKNGYMCVNCPPGTFGSINAAVSTCIPCPLHSYQPRQGQVSCLPCPSGFTTDSTGNKYLTDCKAQHTTGSSPRATFSTITTLPTTSEVGLSATTGKLEPSESKKNESHILEQKGTRSGEQTWKIAVGVTIGMLVLTVLLVLIYLYRKKKMSQKQVSYLHEEHNGPNQHAVFDNPVFDNPVFEQEERFKTKNAMEMCGSSLYKSFDESHDAEALPRSNPLYLAMSGGNDA